MSYENPQIPDGINVGRESPLLEFLRLAAGLAVCLLLLSVVLYVAGGWLARQLPFKYEARLAGETAMDAWLDTRTGDAEGARVRDALQDLADQLAVKMALPAGMRPHLHYSLRDEPNAFAGLGGHVAVTRGLYRLMPSENALAMVLAHEIAHLRARDPIAAVGGGSSLLLVTALLTGNANPLGGAVAGLVQRGYSRRAEARADDAAVAALRQLYGHAGGAAAVFEALRDAHAGRGGALPGWLSTHPLDDERIARLRAAAAGWDAQRQPLRGVPVPPN